MGEGRGKGRAQLYLDKADLDLIDEAARLAGESRVKYMVRACFGRMGKAKEFSAAQADEIRSIVLDVIGEVSSIDWVLKDKDVD